MNDIDRRLELLVTGSENLKDMVGLHTNQIKAHDAKILDLEEQMHRRMDWEKHHDETEVIVKAQKRRMVRAVHARCDELLGITAENGVVSPSCFSAKKKYRGRFITRCWIDAANHSVIERPYDETLSRNYDEGMAYIAKWEPELSYKGLTGAAAFKLYIDDEREAKVKS